MHLRDLVILATIILPTATIGQRLPLQSNSYLDLSQTPSDLSIPVMTEESPTSGKRVRHQLQRYKKTQVHHSLFLPENWIPDQKFPVIVEYAGNGPYRNSLGDRCSGMVEDCNLGYGITGGRDFIWICLPFIDPTHQHNQKQWWGDVDETVLYCQEAVQMVVKDFGGDPNNIFLTGFSRGAIACHYIGLHNDQIAKIWNGFICHSHYDGVRKWNYPNSDQASAIERLKRLNGRPVFITQENSVKAIQQYLDHSDVKGDFQLHISPFKNHSDQWVLRKTPLRKILRDWLQQNLE